jgi:hypothetical protein
MTSISSDTINVADRSALNIVGGNQENQTINNIYPPPAVPPSFSRLATLTVVLRSSFIVVIVASLLLGALKTGHSVLSIGWGNQVNQAIYNHPPAPGA